MAVVLSSASGDYGHFSGASATGAKQVPIYVPDVDDRVVIAAVAFNGWNINIATPTFTTTFDGAPMIELGHQNFTSGGAANTLYLYQLPDPAPGARICQASYSGMPTVANDWWAPKINSLEVAVAVYSGVAEVKTSTVELNTPGSAVNNTVTVESDPDAVPAHRVVSAHAVAAGRYFTSHNRTIRSGPHSVGYGVAQGQLMLADGPGGPSVTATGVHNSATDAWAAIGVALRPTRVQLDASLILSAPVTSASMALYRNQEPHPDRIWRIPRHSRAPIGYRFEPRDPSSVLDYTFDWTDLLAEDDPIINTSFKTNNANVTLLSWNYTAGYATVWVQGGLPSVNPTVTCHITTEAGRQDERTAQIPCAER